MACSFPTYIWQVCISGDTLKEDYETDISYNHADFKDNVSDVDN